MELLDIEKAARRSLASMEVSNEEEPDAEPMAMDE